MSQITTPTAEETFKSLGFTPVAVDHPQRTLRADSVPTKRRITLVATLAMIAMGVGFKLLGDYAADLAIDTWTARAAAQYMLPDPESLKAFERMQQEQLAEDAAADTGSPLSANR